MRQRRCLSQPLLWAICFFKIEGERDGYAPTHSLSFFANLTEIVSSLSFIPKALVSGTSGVFILEPYRNKIQEYVTQEGRSLIEYDLALSEDELSFMMLHIWEMKGIDVQYNLKSHNCASALVTMLSVVDPSYHHFLYKPFMTPNDLLLRFQEENPNFEGHDFITHQVFKEKPNGALGVRTAWGSDRKGDYLSLAVSPAYNDLLDDNRTFGKELDVALFSIGGDYYYDDGFFNLQDVTLIRTKSYVPTTLEDLNLSRHFNVSLENDDIQNDGNSMFAKVATGTGIAFDMTDKALGYIYLNGLYSLFQDKHTLSVSPEIGVFLYEGDYGKTHASFTHYINTNDYKYTSQLSVTQSLFLDKNVTMYGAYEYDVGSIESNISTIVGLKFSF